MTPKTLLEIQAEFAAVDLTDLDNAPAALQAANADLAAFITANPTTPATPATDPIATVVVTTVGGVVTTCVPQA
jgi:hypothetical protein